MKRRTFFGVIAGAGVGAMVPAREPILRAGDKLLVDFTAGLAVTNKPSHRGFRMVKIDYATKTVTLAFVGHVPIGAKAFARGRLRFEPMEERHFNA